MANKNFTQFGLSSFAGNADYLVGYSKDGNQELRYTAGSLLTGGNYDFIINGVNAGRGRGGTDNIVLGASALNNISPGRQNIAIGNFALSACKDGLENIAIGTCALASLSGGDYSWQNLAIGNWALSSLRHDLGNYAIGHYAFKSAIGSNPATSSTGRVVNNLALGREALTSALTASSCTGLGHFTFQSMLSGESSVAVGSYAAYDITASVQNTYVGVFAGTTARRYNCTMLGYTANTTGNNQVQLGGVGTTTYAYGAVQDRSDIRDKADVRDTTLGLDFIMALRPVDFKWDLRDSYKTLPPAAPSPEATEEAKENHRILMEQWTQANDINNIVHDGTHKRSRYHHGLIAQEVKQVLDDKGIDFGGYQDHAIKGGENVQSIGYSELVAPLIKAIQQLKQEFDAYKASHP
jgi:hypothetical protein